MVEADLTTAGVPIMKDRDFVYCEVRQQAPGGVYVIYGESLSDEEAAQVPEPLPFNLGYMRKPQAWCALCLNIVLI